MTGKRKTFLSFLLVSPIFLAATSFAEIPFNVVNSPIYTEDFETNTIDSKFTIKAILNTNTFEIKCNDNVDKDIIFPNHYKIDVFEYKIVKISDNGCKDLNINSIILPSSITEIGISAFENNNLQQINIPTTIINIGDKAFKNNQLGIIHSNPKTAPTIGLETFVGNQIEKTWIRQDATGYDTNLGWINPEAKKGDK